MNFVKTLPFVPAVILALTTSALGQDTPPPPVPKGYLTAVGGAAFNLDFEHPTPTIAIEYGERVHHDVQAYANFSFVNNVMSDTMRQHLVTAGEMFDDVFSGRDRALTFSMGAKYLLPSDMKFRPYVGGGLGIINLKRRITEAEFGDVSDFFYALTGLNDGVMNAGDTSVNKPLGEILVGVNGVSGKAFVDISYRYRRAFNPVTVEFSQVTFAVGMAW